MNSIKFALVACLISMAVLETETVRAQEPQHRTQSYWFDITAHGSETHDFGSWSEVSGLDVEFDLAEYRSGGAANVFRQQFPGNTNYGTVTLGRSSSNETDLVVIWLRHMAATGDSPTLVITLFDETGDAVARWQLENVLPRKYTVGGLNAEGTDVAIETLVLSHEGLSLACERDC